MKRAFSFPKQGQPFEVLLYNFQTGATVGYIEPPQNCVGWMDACECLSVYRRKNGEDLMIEEQDGRAKNLLYRRNPLALPDSR